MTSSKRSDRHCAVLLTALLLQACGGGGAGTADTPTTAATTAVVTAPVNGANRLTVSQSLFRETALSASGRLSCATCHTDETAHSTASLISFPTGGPNMDQQVPRASPSILYLQANRAFNINDNGNPSGGFNWDGRFNSRAQQATGPLLAANEMANVDVAAVARKVRGLPYFNDFVSAFGISAQAGDQLVFDTLLQALENYQQQDPDYLLFNSKYDRFLDGTTTLTAQETRGLNIFNDPNKGNCDSCHTSRIGQARERPLFTNFRYAALGLPRNSAITANADSNFFDMGLCGPTRTDLTARTDLCGHFKIPTLRNIAITAPYFHNSSIATLTNAVEFYATRDTNPSRWYPIVLGVVEKFNDLPVQFRNNVRRTRPFGQNAGDPPALTAQDVADLVAFLQTLSDDRNAAPGAATVP